MIKYHSFKAEHIILSLAIFIVGAFFGIYGSHADNLPFGSTLTGMFPGIESNYSSIHFKYGGNDFAGMFFRTTGTNLTTPETIHMSGSAQTINCYQKINGIYYNNQRGRKIWPLDTGNLAKLTTQDSGYAVLQITGGLYTNCTGVSGYTPSATAVFGQITHTRSGTTFNVIAGVNYNFTGNDIAGTGFGNTLYGISNVASGYIFDNYGGIGEVGSGHSGTMLLSFGTETSTGGDICGSFSITPNTITGGNTTIFSCYGDLTGGNIITGYTLAIYTGSGGGTAIYSNILSTGTNFYQRTTGNALAAGSYNATCTILGSGVGAGGTCDGPKNFTVTAPTVTPPSTGSTCGFQGNIAIIPTTATVRRSIGDTWYTKTTGGVDIQIWSTIPSYYVISGTEMTNTITGFYNYTYSNTNPIVNTGKIYLSTGDGIKQINSVFTSGGCAYTAPQKYITLDLLPPTTPTSMSPTNGSGICYIGDSNFSWSGSIDSGVGITQYNYKVYSNTGLTTTLLNGTTGNTSISINASIFGSGYFTGTYYRSVQAIDGLGQTGNMLTGTFKVGIEYCTNSGNIMIHGTIPRLRNADLNKEYLSDPFTVDGLPGPIVAYLSTGVLIVNGTGMRSTGYISNGDELNIKLKSSTQYDTTLNAVFYVGPRFATYHITTKSLTGYAPTSGCILETGQKLIIQNIFDMMKDTYNADQGTLSDFLFTIQSMLQDETDLTNNCSLQYLLDTVDSYIMDNISESTIDESIHKAPNCKEYEIKFMSSRSGYTSPTFKHKKTYFATREGLIRYIDSKNPGDCNINTYEDMPEIDNSELSGYYTAPNGRSYQIKDKEGSGTILYYSPDFLKAKYFENEDDLFKFIDTNNPTIEIWNHEVDGDFEPEIHTAPNGKEYKIYGTDQGFMSYKLMTVQYFDTLEEIQSYIDKNNR